MCVGTLTRGHIGQASATPARRDARHLRQGQETGTGLQKEWACSRVRVCRRDGYGSAAGPRDGLAEGMGTANLCTTILDFRGFDSSIM